MSDSQRKFGRIVVDNRGISKRKWLFMGNGFQMSWEEMEAWAISEMILTSRDTGEEKVLNQTLELHSAAVMEIIQKPETIGHFGELLAYLRQRCPEKEKQSLILMYKTLSGGGRDALNALLQQYSAMLHEELERFRHEFPQPTKTEYTEIFALISNRIAEAKGLSKRHAEQIVFWHCEKHAPDMAQATRRDAETDNRTKI